MSVNDTETDQPISPSLPGPWAWVALAIILLLGAAGFLKGLSGSKPIASILAPVKGLPAVVALTASDAAPMPHNDDWSVLSGPKILPPRRQSRRRSRPRMMTMTRTPPLISPRPIWTPRGPTMFPRQRLRRGIRHRLHQPCHSRAFLV